MQHLSYKELFKNNEIWIKEKTEKDTNYFEKLAKGQDPRYLMIGCSDSRVPISSMFNADPGEIFIHRNIANQVGITDMNLLSVLQYSVEVLKVERIFVVGHYRCGGVAAAVDCNNDGLIENWVSPIKDLYVQNMHKFDFINDKQNSLDKLSEVNTIEQVKNIFKTSIMHKALDMKQYPSVHALIFDIYTGKIRELDLPVEEWKTSGLIPEYY